MKAEYEQKILLAKNEGQEIIKQAENYESSGLKKYVEENNIIPKWEYKKRLKLILDGDSRKDNEIALDLLNQGKSLEYVCEE